MKRPPPTTITVRRPRCPQCGVGGRYRDSRRQKLQTTHTETLGEVTHRCTVCRECGHRFTVVVM